MLRIQRACLAALVILWPGSLWAEETCDALGHLLLASDLMRIAAQAGGDLSETYGPSIGASLRSSNDLPQELRDRRPGRVSALEGLRQIASTALAFVSAGQAEPETLEEAGMTVARDGRQLYVDWTCDDPEAGDGNGDLTGGEDSERDPSSGRVGDGEGGLTFRAVWIALGNENRLERSVLLGCFATSAILLPYLLLRDRRNRRRAERYPCTLPTTLTIAGVKTDATFFDVSITGARLTLPVVLQPGTEVTVEIAGEKVAAEVVRSGKGFAGLEFAATLRQELMEALLAEIKKATSWAARYPEKPPEPAEAPAAAAMQPELVPDQR